MGKWHQEVIQTFEYRIHLLRPALIIYVVRSNLTSNLYLNDRLWDRYMTDK